MKKVSTLLDITVMFALVLFFAGYWIANEYQKATIAVLIMIFWVLVDIRNELKK